eukprot:m.197054 g.197054  ORF g.197054 m.197054 type:complete len:51 (+) comp13680_c0_seq22:4262-4414(+)
MKPKNRFSQHFRVKKPFESGNQKETPKKVCKPTTTKTRKGIINTTTSFNN